MGVDRRTMLRPDWTRVGEPGPSGHPRNHSLTEFSTCYLLKGGPMDPYAAHHALSVLEARTTVPTDEKERIAVLRSFRTLAKIATLYREATEAPNAPAL